MIKEIELTNDEFNSAVSIIKELKDTGKLSIRMNRKTYGGLITLNGTSEEIEFLCSALKNNGIATN